MTHQYAKSIRNKLRELAGLAHERELSRAYDDDLFVYRAVKLGFLSREEVPEKVAEAILLDRPVLEQDREADIIHVMQEFVTPRYPATSAPEQSHPLLRYTTSLPCLALRHFFGYITKVPLNKHRTFHTLSGLVWIRGRSSVYGLGDVAQFISLYRQEGNPREYPLKNK